MTLTHAAANENVISQILPDREELWISHHPFFSTMV